MARVSGYQKPSRKPLRGHPFSYLEKNSEKVLKKSPKRRPKGPQEHQKTQKKLSKHESKKHVQKRCKKHQKINLLDKGTGSACYTKSARRTSNSSNSKKYHKTVEHEALLRASLAALARALRAPQQEKKECVFRFLGRVLQMPLHLLWMSLQGGASIWLSLGGFPWVVFFWLLFDFPMVFLCFPL